ncbi:hypothetical protein HTV45_30055 [Streptomyces sp. CHD11]|uniref:hypothetical protein n=1 Tax=Streptomyces sp. CHD11 TaxID=2741325 RepID=UPI001BFC6D5B|nr:hypothetical protein [Streptomyces sp. CHD11]MBT3155067.1 hypothetical protein [Streptomyces sp. CHD11]
MAVSPVSHIGPVATDRSLQGAVMVAVLRGERLGPDMPDVPDDGQAGGPGR